MRFVPWVVVERVRNLVTCVFRSLASSRALPSCFLFLGSPWFSGSQRWCAFVIRRARLRLLVHRSHVPRQTASAAVGAACVPSFVRRRGSPRASASSSRRLLSAPRQCLRSPLGHARARALAHARQHLCRSARRLGAAVTAQRREGSATGLAVKCWPPVPESRTRLSRARPVAAAASPVLQEAAEPAKSVRVLPLPTLNGAPTSLHPSFAQRASETQPADVNVSCIGWNTD